MTLRALSIAAAGSSALLRRMDALCANLANAGTPGARRLPLEDSFNPGTLQATQRDWDVAIEGEGFLRVLLADGTTAFTRAGTLSRNSQGYLAAGGQVIDPPMPVPPFITKLTIDPDGFVQGVDPKVPEAGMPIGQIELCRFAHPSGLEPVTSSLFRATDAAGDRVDGRPGEGVGTIRQGHLEESTIDPMRELMELVHVQRAFELNNRVIQAADEILQSINHLRRKP
ncbi:MAG TPA: flagellar hook-basal body complex protein [Planctomycetota bacterium]|jgi:flagellar basal-body rod protein FlgG|nr:flagellar hook-basal body complex protein [Planctomycetota bacterium]